MDIRTDHHINPLEALIAAVVVGVVLVVCGVSVHRSLSREQDAMRAASLAGSRAALERYAATKGEFPSADTPINLAGGCVDGEGGVYSKAGRGNCTTTLFAVSSQSDVVYQSSADRKGYALYVIQDRYPPNIVLCGTPRGIERTAVCTPTARSFAQ